MCCYFWLNSFFFQVLFLFGFNYSNPSCVGPFCSIYSKDCFILSYLLKFYKVSEALRNKGRGFNSEKGMGNVWLREHYWYVDGKRAFILDWEKDRNPEYILSIWLLSGRDSPPGEYCVCMVRTLSCATPIAPGHMARSHQVFPTSISDLPLHLSALPGLL